MIDKFVHFQIKYAKILLVILLIILGCAGYIAKDLQIEPSFSALVPQESQFNTNDRILRNAFETNDAVLLVIKEDPNSRISNSISDMNIILQEYRYIEDLKATLIQSPYVRQINGPFISEDSRVMQLSLILATPDKVGGFKESLDQINELSNQVGAPPGIITEVTGLPVLLDRVSTLLIQDNLTTIAITLIFIFLVLFWYSRDVVFSLIAMSTPVSSLILLAAAMVIYNIPVTITLAAVGVLVLGLGADYSIHLATHYRAARRELGNHEDALIKTMNDLFVPITASFTTTLAGFTALIFGVSPSSQAQGLVLNLGIIMIFISTIFLFPIVLSSFSKSISVKSNKSFRKIISVLTNLAIFQTKRPILVILGVVFVTIIMMFGASQVKFSTSNSNWIPDGDPISESFRELNYAFGNTDSITLVLKSTQGDLRDVQTIRDLKILESKIYLYPTVDNVRSPFQNINEYSSAQINNYITNTPQIREQFNSDYTLTRMVITSENFAVDDSGGSQILDYIKEIIAETPIHNTEVGLYGDIVRFNELGDNLQRDAGITTMIGLLLVFFVASAIYASVVVGIIALIPIIIAVIWAVGLMGFFNVPFTSLSTGIISLVLGIGVDFSIHLVDGIKRFLRQGQNIKDAVSNTLETSGAAVFLASVTTFIGFLALTFATLLGTQRLGWSLAFSIVGVFFVTITLVPAIMTLNSRSKKKKNA